MGIQGENKSVLHLQWTAYQSNTGIGVSDLKLFFQQTGENSRKESAVSEPSSVVSCHVPLNN